jgi:hypothetical protein
MRFMYEFRCDNGHTTEAFRDSEIDEIDCPECDLKARKIISAVRSALDPISGDFLGATEKWARNRKQKMEQERKANS